MHTVHKDIVALLATKKRSSGTIKPAATKRKHNDDNDSSKPKKRSSPDFITHYKDSSDTKYKVGDKKTFNDQTFYFYDALTHREKLKWHTHKVDNCWARKKWMKKENLSDVNSTPDLEANVGEIDADANVEPQQDTASDINALLATAINLVVDNSMVRDQN